VVWVNAWLVQDLRTPFGGMKHSGVGREGGNEALRFFTEERVYQAVAWAFPALGVPAMRQRGPGIPAGWWGQRPPYTATRVRR
jgi:hypothetical protein